MSDNRPGDPDRPTVPGTIVSEHSYTVPVGPDVVWEQISDVAAYQTWWSWLRTFDAAGLRAGDEWRCVVQPPLPYLVRFTVHIEEVEEHALVRARIAGDVVGAATLRLAESAGGCTAVLSSSLAPGNTVLRLMSSVAAPIARFGHDWVLDSGARQFIARAITPMRTE